MRWRVTASNRESYQRLSAWLASAGIVAIPCDGDWPPPETVTVDADALLLGGGGDLSDEAGRYDAPPGILRGCCPERDAAEFAWARAYWAAARPVFGVCRGLQVIAVSLGARLVPDVQTRWPALDEAHEASIGDARHGLRATGEGPMARALRHVTVVNSAHHQTVGTTGEFAVSARSLAGLIEAIETPPNSCARASAVQWHPERLPFDDPAARRVLEVWQQEADR